MKQLDDLANLLINPKGSTPIYNCFLYLNDTEKNMNYRRAFGCNNISEETADINYRFRTGSITKAFTATLILQLMEEGLLSLDDAYLDCLINPKTKKYFAELLFFDGINYSNKIITTLCY